MTTSIFLLLVLFCTSTRAGADLPGVWELLVPDVGIASMHTAVTRFNTVVLLDRTHISPSRKLLPENRCLVNPVNPNRRPLTISTDTWCSSGQFLPDGTIIQTDGDFDGFKKIRKFTPCEPGSLCDW